MNRFLILFLAGLAAGGGVFGLLGSLGVGMLLSHLI